MSDAPFPGSSPLRHARSRFAAALLWFLSAWIVVRKLAVPLYDEDLWWHLAAGREMIRRGAVPRTDVFSSTLPGTPWIDFEWLSQAAMYVLWKAGGLWALYGAKILLSLSVLGVLGWTFRRLGARGAVLVAACWAAFFALRPRLFERTELATLNCLAFLVFLVLAARSPGRARKALPWALSGMMVLWVNLHAGFIYGLAALAAFAVGARWAKEDAGFIRALDRAFTWSLAAVFVNPYGPKIVEMFVEVAVALRGAPALIDEWRAPAVG